MPTFTTTEAASRLGLKTARAVSLLIRRGALKGEKRGRDWFVSEEEIERYNAARKPVGRPKKNSDARPDETRAGA